MSKIIKVHLVRVAVKTEDKDGKPLVNSFGKPYKKIGIQTKEHGSVWLSGFLNSPKDPRNFWQIGQEKDIIVTQNGDFTNFNLPERIDYLEERVTRLEQTDNRTQDVELDVSQDLPTDEIDPNGLNF